MTDEARSRAPDAMPSTVRALHLFRPTPPTLLVALALIVLLAGAAYCSGYEALMRGRMDWPGSLLWSAYAVLPWLFLFEFIKRREWGADRPFPLRVIAMMLVATGAASIGVEIVYKELMLGRDSPPVALQILRRLPAVAAMVLLLTIARLELRSSRKRARPSADGVAEEAETLRRHAASIRWIRAADNYLELHLEGRVWTRRLTMREAAEILEPLGFVRVHRSVIVNRSYVASVVQQSGGALVRMADGAALPTGRAFSSNLRQLH